MKKFIAEYMLYVYINFIKDDDIEIYKDWALPIIHFINFTRSVYIWIASVIFFPIFYFGMIFDVKYKEFEKELQKNINIYFNKTNIK